MSSRWMYALRARPRAPERAACAALRETRPRLATCNLAHVALSGSPIS